MPSELILLKFEIVIFLLSCLYIFHYIWGKIYKIYSKTRKLLKKENVEDVKVALNKLDLNTKHENYKKAKNHKRLTNDEIRQLTDLLKRVQLNSSKGYFDTAKSLIIEGFTIDKFNVSLNLELANIYIQEENYSNAEHIYKDLIEISKGDFELYKKLAYTYFMQGNLEEARKNYEKVNKKNSADEEAINMLSEITYDLKDWKAAINYLNQYLKSKPKDVDKMTMKAIAFEQLRDFNSAIETHKKILELQPYNTFSRDKVRELNSMVV